MFFYIACGIIAADIEYRYSKKAKLNSGRYTKVELSHPSIEQVDSSEKLALLEQPGRKEFIERATQNFVDTLLIPDISDEIKMDVYEHFVDSVHISMLARGETVENTYDSLHDIAKSKANSLVVAQMSKADISNSQFAKPYVDTQDLTGVLQQVNHEEPVVVTKEPIPGKIKRHLAILAGGVYFR